jgi:hypothetical protein
MRRRHPRKGAGMNEELLSQVGFGDERIYSWVYTQHQTRPEHAYKQAFRLDITPEVIALVELAVKKEREACAKVCDARYMGDNNREDMEARRCAAAIRARGQE